MMIEPTETESKETPDAFIEAMKQIAREAEENPICSKMPSYDSGKTPGGNPGRTAARSALAAITR